MGACDPFPFSAPGEAATFGVSVGDAEGVGGSLGDDSAFSPGEGLSSSDGVRWCFLCGLGEGLLLAFDVDFFFGLGVGAGVSSGDSEAFFSETDGEAEGEWCGEGFGLVFFFVGDGEGEDLRFLCGVGVGVAKTFFTRSANDSCATT